MVGAAQARITGTAGDARAGKPLRPVFAVSRRFHPRLHPQADDRVAGLGGETDRPGCGSSRIG
jgi:hypothetical protein